MRAAAVHRRRGTLLGALVLIQLETACYRVVPVTTMDGMRAGTRLELLLTPQGSVDLTASVGPRVERLTGDLVSGSGDTVVVALIRAEQANGTAVSWQRQSVSVPRAAIASFGERRIDKKRSWLTALAVAAFATLAAALSGGIGGGAGDGQPVISPPG